MRRAKKLRAREPGPANASLVGTQRLGDPRFMDALFSSGILMAWWMLIPGIGIAAMWFFAIVADRELDRQRTRTKL